MRLAPVLAALLLAAALAGCTAPAPPAGPPTQPPPDDGPPRPPRVEAWPAWEVGERWAWQITSFDSAGRATRGNVSGQVVLANATHYVVAGLNERGEPTNQTFWRSNLSITSSKVDALVLPLEANATWRSTAAVGRVLGVERVTVPAGSFDAWHVNLTTGPMDHANGTLRAVTGWRDDWWAPETKVWVKSRHVRIFAGTHLVLERELETYRPVSGT